MVARATSPENARDTIDTETTPSRLFHHEQAGFDFNWNACFGGRGFMSPPFEEQITKKSQTDPM